MQAVSYRVFMSHSHCDNTWCDAFASELTRQGMNVWYDRQGLYIGAQWVKEIETELRQREIFLLIISPDSMASPWVQEEISMALVQRKRIIGVIHRPTEIQGFIANYQMFPVVGMEALPAAYTIVQAIRAIPPQVMAAPTPLPHSAPAGTQPPLSPPPMHAQQQQRYDICMIVFVEGKQWESAYWEAVLEGTNQSIHKQRVGLRENFQVGYSGGMAPQQSPTLEQLRLWLYQQGWEELPDRGPAPYNHRFRRRAP